MRLILERANTDIPFFKEEGGSTLEKDKNELAFESIS